MNRGCGYPNQGPVVPNPDSKFYGCVTGEIHLHTEFSVCARQFNTSMLLKVHTYDPTERALWDSMAGKFTAKSLDNDELPLFDVGQTSWKDADWGFSSWQVGIDGNSGKRNACKLPGGALEGIAELATENIHTGFSAAYTVFKGTRSVARDEHCFFAEWNIFATPTVWGDGCLKP
jgi:hypothetical protein